MLSSSSSRTLEKAVRLTLSPIALFYYSEMISTLSCQYKLKISRLFSYLQKILLSKNNKFHKVFFFLLACLNILLLMTHIATTVYLLSNNNYMSAQPWKIHDALTTISP